MNCLYSLSVSEVSITRLCWHALYFHVISTLINTLSYKHVIMSNNFLEVSYFKPSPNLLAFQNCLDGATLTTWKQAHRFLCTVKPRAPSQLIVKLEHLNERKKINKIKISKLIYCIWARFSKMWVNTKYWNILLLSIHNIYEIYFQLILPVSNISSQNI